MGDSERRGGRHAAADAAAVNLESNVDLAYDVRIEAESLLREDDEALRKRSSDAHPDISA